MTDLEERVARAIYEEVGSQNDHNSWNVWQEYYKREAKVAIVEVQKSLPSEFECVTTAANVIIEKNNFRNLSAKQINDISTSANAIHKLMKERVK